MSERKIKGVVIVPLAMIIKDQKQLDWLGQTELTAEDMKKINEGILTSAWHDIGLFDRAGNAVFKLVGQGKPEMAFEFGRGILCKILLSVYRSPLKKNDPTEILTRFAGLYNGTWFQSGIAKFERTETGGSISVSEPEGIPCQQGFASVFKGVLFQMVKENGGQDIKIDCREEAVPQTRKITALNYQISWEPKGW